MPCGRSITIQGFERAMRHPNNRHDAIIVDEEHLFPYWLEPQIEQHKLTRKEADQIWERIDNGVWPADPEAREHVEWLMETMLGNTSDAMDANKARRLLRDFGGLGQFRENTYRGQRYVIFKGNPRLRRIFKGTRYRADNPRLVAFGIGRLGVEDTLKKGGMFTIALLAPFRVLQYVYDDERTLVWLTGTLGTDLFKAGIAALIAGLATVMAVKFFGVVAGGLVITVAVGLPTSFILDRLDDSLNLTDRLVSEMEVTLEKAIKANENAVNAMLNTPCRIRNSTRQAADEAIDAFATAFSNYAKRTGRALIDRFVREQLYPGWFYKVAR